LGDARAISWLGDADAIVARLDGEALASRSISLAFPSVTIAGLLDQRTTHGIQRWTAGAASSKHRIALWVAHLLAQIDAETRGEAVLTSRLIHREGTVVLAPVADARAKLADLLDGLGHFLRAPMPLFPASSYAWIERDQKLRAGSTRAKKSPEDMARDEWSKDLGSWAIERCWGDLDAIAHPDFIPWARRLWEPIFLATEGE
jgi:exonuclease V gamma subunit